MISFFKDWFEKWLASSYYGLIIELSTNEKTEKVKYSIILSRYANYLHKQEFIQATLMSVIQHKKLNLKIEFWKSIFIYLFLIVCVFFLLLEFICSSVCSNQNLEVSTCFIYAAVWLSSHT